MESPALRTPGIQRILALSSAVVPEHPAKLSLLQTPTRSRGTPHLSYSGAKTNHHDEHNAAKSPANCKDGRTPNEGCELEEVVVNLEDKGIMSSN